MFARIRSTYRAAFADLSRDVWAIALVTFVYRCGTMVLPFMALYLTSERGFTTTEAGLLLAIYGAGALGGSLLGGWLGDTHGPLRVCTTSLVLSGTALLLLKDMESFASVAVMLLAFSLVSEAYRPASAAAVAAMSRPSTRVRAVALRRLAINLGMSIAPAVGGALAVIDYSWLFVVDGASCFAAALLLFGLFRHEISGSPHVAHAHSGTPSMPSPSPWADGSFVFLLALTALFAGVFFQVFSTFPLMLRDLFLMKEDTIGRALALNALLIVLFEMVTMHLARGRPPLHMMRIGSLFACAGFAVLPWGVGLGIPWVLLVVVLITCGEMFFMPMAEGFIANRAQDGNRGRYMGLYTLAYSVAFAGAPALGTTVYDRWGASALAGACAVSGVLLWLGFTRLTHRLVAPPHTVRSRPTAAPRRPLP